jgi:uncharacterized LabA/DUF88 family protein
VDPGFLFIGVHMMKRVIFFIDGSNLYHALRAEKRFSKYKWLNLSKLVTRYTTQQETIAAIYYFTALATWSQSKVQKHRLFIKAQEMNGVKIVYGEFKRKDKYCNLCRRYYVTYEEKQTDVNIAIQLFKLSIEDQYDKAMLISGDSDLIPSIHAVRHSFPHKKIGVIIPIGRRAEALKQACDFHMKMKEIHLQTSLLEKQIILPSGEQLLCPPEWQ